MGMTRKLQIYKLPITNDNQFINQRICISRLNIEYMNTLVHSFMLSPKKDFTLWSRLIPQREFEIKLLCFDEKWLDEVKGMKLKTVQCVFEVSLLSLNELENRQVQDHPWAKTLDYRTGRNPMFWSIRMPELAWKNNVNKGLLPVLYSRVFAHESQWGVLSPRPKYIM